MTLVTHSLLHHPNTHDIPPSPSASQRQPQCSFAFHVTGSGAHQSSPSILTTRPLRRSRPVAGPCGLLRSEHDLYLDCWFYIPGTEAALAMSAHVFQLISKLRLTNLQFLAPCQNLQLLFNNLALCESSPILPKFELVLAGCGYPHILAGNPRYWRHPKAPL